MRGSLVGSRSIVGGARVLDISDITGVLIGHGVGHSLDATVGKGNVVLSLGGVAIAGLLLAKVGTRVVVLDGVSVLIGGRLGVVTAVRGLSGVGGHAGGHGDEGREGGNEEVHVECKMKWGRGGLDGWFACWWAN